MDHRTALYRIAEETGKAHRALDARDADKFHAIMLLVESIAFSVSKPRERANTGNV